jgi:hypothetical protein
MKKLILLVAIAISVGCVSLQTRFTNAGEQIVALINTGEVEKLGEMTQTPFLLDGEIILLDEDMASFWRNIFEAGFRVNEPMIRESSAVGTDTYREFGETMEVSSFFEKYLSDRSHVVYVDTTSFSLVFLLDRARWGKVRILGFKGPIWRDQTALLERPCGCP